MPIKPPAKKFNLNLQLTGFSLKRVATVFFYLAVIATMVLLWGGVWVAFKIISDDEWLSGSTEETAETATTETACNTQGIALHGDLVTYAAPDETDEDGYATADQTASEDIVYYIETAEKDASIKAILLEIDSYGGSPVAAEEVASALRHAQKPTVALIRNAGDSAAYWAATGASIIFASKNSDVGGIGVTMSYLDAAKQDQRDGLTFNQLSAGAFKDYGNPDKPLTSEERALFMRDINILHQNFIQAVTANRNLDIQKVTSLADGSSVLGEAALADGLIDRIGGEFEVKEYLKEKIGAEVEICW